MGRGLRYRYKEIYTLSRHLLNNALVIAAMMLTGCAAGGVWMKNGADDSARLQAQTVCQRQTDVETTPITRRNGSTNLLGTLVVGGFEILLSAWNDSHASTQCMERLGWRLQQGGPVLAAVQQPVPLALATTVAPTGPLSDADPLLSPAGVRAIGAAQVWIISQRVLNGDTGPVRQQSLYRTLCRAGDDSSCFMAGVPLRN